MSKTQWQIEIKPAENPRIIDLSVIAKVIAEDIKNKEGKTLKNDRIKV